MAVATVDISKGVDSLMGAFSKRWVIRKRRARRQKIDLLRRRYVAAKSDAERQAVVTKAKKVSPQMTVEQFVSAIRGGKT